ncbi:hypothetical protein GDO86_005997 [Hymenochirus boettgeri]|uniref:Transcription initiation factor TFIID subunit 3 n=1 Tax=Hymenochirus boettgeri TaxID=247094 RepID=A0A8T2JC62_9PIPI|nr:hypothetical protein GDO86_005997 [Hymenochirus boettgeri]
MQVPLEEEEEEEEGEIEDDETVNDENYLSKRPIDSPESLEMPFAKRPRLLNSKGDVLDGSLEPREPLSSINSQKVPAVLSPSHILDGPDLAVSSSEQTIITPVIKSQSLTPKPLEAKPLTPKVKSKGGSPGQKTKSPKGTPVASALGSPIRSPKSAPKEKKSPGRAKSPKSPKSPKVSLTAVPPVVKADTPNRTPLAALSEKFVRDNIQVKQSQASVDLDMLNIENSTKKTPVADNTIEDSIDAVIARACAEREPDPFEFSSGSESEGEAFTSPKRLTISEPATPKISASNIMGKASSTPLPPSAGTSSSDISWTMDDSINEVIRKVNQEAPTNTPVNNVSCYSSPSASPPTPEPLLKMYEDKIKVASPVEVKKKTKKELKPKLKKKDKEKMKDKEKERTKDKNKDKNKEKEGSKDGRVLWKDPNRDDDDQHRIKLKELNELDIKSKQKENCGKKDKEKHKDKKKDKEKGKKDKEKKGKDKSKEEKLKVPTTPIMITPKEIGLSMISTPNAVRLPSLLPSMSPILQEKLFEEKEKPKEKDKKKDKKEKKKKKEKEKLKEKDKKEKEKEKDKKEKDKHKHEKAKTELTVPAPSPVIPRLTLRVGAGQDTIVISKVVSTPESKTGPPPSLPKSPPPAPSPAPAPVLIVPPPVQPPPAPAAASPTPAPPPAGQNVGTSKTPVRSVVTETVSTYVIRDEWGNQIWICPGCNKPDDGSPMIGCDICDDWYHWPCVGITAAPPEDEQWFCSKCESKKKDKKHKKRKHKAH